MPKAERDFFVGHLRRPSTKFYFEFGSGGSTYAAIHSPNIEKIISMESDTAFYESKKHVLVSPKCEYRLVEVGCRNNWGNPAPGYDGKLYFSRMDESKDAPDLILVDGRWRVACALHSWFAMNEKSVLLFDDYVNRPFYHVVETYFHRVQTVGRMVALRKNVDKEPPASLLRTYEQDCR